MDTRTGKIYDLEKNPELVKKFKEDPLEECFFKQVGTTVLSGYKKDELSRTGRTKVGRNDPCPCGSGKKFKKCCYFYGPLK